MPILITGATGYIGAHTTLELLNAGHDLIALDNLSHSSRESLERVFRLAGRSCPFHRIDLRDLNTLDHLFQNEMIDGVIHFAGLKSVSESTQKPLHYYDNNVAGTINLLRIMQKHRVKSILFSSSCTVYGEPVNVPVDENTPVGNISSPYGRTKWIVEEMLKDLQRSEPGWSVSLLRYFNPIGAHPSGEIGEESGPIPNHLMPYITRVALGELQKLNVFGDDYPTPDGTAVRDYIHVVDLARGHLNAWQKQPKVGMAIYNLGTGRGYSVLEVIRTFETVTGIAIPYTIADRRPGDVTSVWSNPGLANRELNWKATLNLEQMCRDSWNWQSRNPNGYADSKPKNGEGSC